MALPTDLGELTLNTVGEAIAFAAGVALSPTLAPVAHAIEQEAWKVAPILAVDPGDAAGIAAERVSEYDWAADQAIKHGIVGDSFQKIYQEALNAPGVGELLQMLRRGTIEPDDFIHGLNKLKLEDQWNTPLADLQQARIDASVVATAIQRGIMPDPGYLPTSLDFSGSNVPPPTMSQLDPVAEAAASGIDSDRLAVYTRIVGLPPAPGELMSLVNRGTINDDAFRMGIAEGNTRNEWADVLLTLKRRLLTPHEYEEAALRGVLSNDDADTGAALSGMESEDAQLLFAIMGRPLPVHQITTALARGGTYGGTYDDVPEPYRDAIRRSSTRPEYAPMAYANRYTIPSYFILKAILADGGMTTAEFAQYGKDLGWPPDLADKASAALSTGSAAKADPWIGKAQTQLWTAVHKAYVDDLATEDQARADFVELQVADASQTEVIRLWNAERAIRRANLTVKQIQDAIGQPNHGVPWATQLLSDQGYNADKIAALIGPAATSASPTVTPTA